MLILNVFLYCFLLILAPQKAHAQLQTVPQMMQNVTSSLVQIRTEDTRTFTEADGHTRTATYHTEGSGIIIDSHGLIVTNTHIVANAPHIFVGLSDGTILEAKLVYSSEADFSFIKIDPPYPLETITWADSSLAQIGTSVITLTSAQGDQVHILGGEITDRLNGASSNEIEVFALNIPLEHGDSGGPLLDKDGHLLGMIMAKKISEDNKTYAIASNKIQQEYTHYQQTSP